jgi:hypothetical protein
MSSRSSIVDRIREEIDRFKATHSDREPTALLLGKQEAAALKAFVKWQASAGDQPLETAGLFEGIPVTESDEHSELTAAD